MFILVTKLGASIHKELKSKKCKCENNLVVRVRSYPGGMQRMTRMCNITLLGTYKIQALLSILPHAQYSACHFTQAQHGPWYEDYKNKKN